jgi:hypothetical protein
VIGMDRHDHTTRHSSGKECGGTKGGDDTFHGNSSV